MYLWNKKQALTTVHKSSYLFILLHRRKKKTVLFNKLSNTEEPSWTGAPNMYMKSVAFTGKEREKGGEMRSDAAYTGSTHRLVLH